MVGYTNSGLASFNFTNMLFAAGVLNANSATLRQHWLADLNPVLAKCGLVMVDDERDWEGWNGRFRHIDHE